MSLSARALLKRSFYASIFIVFKNKKRGRGWDILMEKVCNWLVQTIIVVDDTRIRPSSFEKGPSNVIEQQCVIVTMDNRIGEDMRFVDEQLTWCPFGNSRRHQCI